MVQLRSLRLVVIVAVTAAAANDFLAHGNISFGILFFTSSSKVGRRVFKAMKDARPMNSIAILKTDLIGRSVGVRIHKGVSTTCCLVR